MCFHVKYDGIHILHKMETVSGSNSKEKMHIPAQHPHGKYQVLKVNTVIKEDSDSGCTWVRQNQSITQSLSLIAKAGSQLLERRATSSVGIN